MARTFRHLAAAGAVLLALPSAAWADLDAFVTSAGTDAVSLSVFEGQVGSTLVQLGSTSASGTSAPAADAAVTLGTVAGTAAGEVATASSDGERVADPAEGDGCAAPVTVPGVTIDALCATAVAAAAPGGDVAAQNARAEVLLAGVDVDGSLLADALTTPLDELLESILDGIGAAALADGLDQFTTACEEFLPLDDEDDPTDEVPDAVQDLLDMSPAELESAEEVLDSIADNPCSALLDLSAGELTQDVIDVGPLADALAGVDLLSLTLSGATSQVAGSGAGHTATAEQVLVAVDGPSLDFLDDVIVALVEGAVNGIGQELADLAGQPFPEELDLSDELAEGLDQIGLLDDSSPLLAGVISGGSATASVDRASSTTSGGGDLPYVSLTIAPGVVELLGGDPEMATITLTAGQTQTVGEGTPLESTVSVGDNVVDEDAFDDDSGLNGTTSSTSVTTVALLTGVEGGIQLALGGSNAAAFGESLTTVSEPDPAPDPEPPLPRTGGGAVIAAVLALGAAFALWRRRGADDDA